MRLIARIFLGSVASLLSFSLFWAASSPRWSGGHFPVSLMGEILALFSYSAFPILLGAMLLAIVPTERAGLESGHRIPTRGRIPEWIIAGTLVFGGFAFGTASDRFISALFSGGLAAVIGGLVFDKAPLWASATSWICLVSAIVLPLVFVVLVNTPVLPHNSVHRNNLLLCFVGMQAVAIFLGIVSSLGSTQGSDTGTCKRSIAGIMLGFLAGAFMWFGTAAVGLGR